MCCVNMSDCLIENHIQYRMPKCCNVTIKYKINIMLKFFIK